MLSKQRAFIIATKIKSSECGKHLKRNYGLSLKQLKKDFINTSQKKEKESFKPLNIMILIVNLNVNYVRS
ncbi:MAG: hypothetical protein CMG85_17325 [Marinobacter sp.]|nr:hypothetical protein [Marinobacter sp.]